MSEAHITSVEPQQGSRDGGDTVHAHGQHLDEIHEVIVGHLGSVHVEHVSAEQLTFVTPASGSVGPAHDLRVELDFRAADGTSVTPGWAFTYSGSVPTVTSIEPLHGNREGGDTVHVHGHNLAGLTQVAIGNVATVQLQHVSDTEATFVTPTTNSVGPMTDHREGVVFYASDGSMVTDSWMVFTYGGSTPTISWVEPTHVHAAGGDVVQVGGVHVDHLTGVAFGDLGDLPLHPVSEGIVSFTVPALPAGRPANADLPMGIVFHTTDGVDLPWPNVITYTPGHLVVPDHDHRAPSSDAAAPGGRPSIRQLQPSTGPRGGGQWISIIGDQLDHAASVTFGGVPAHFETRTSMELVVYPPSYDPSMGATDVLVEVHSHSHGVSTENVHYRYGAAPDADAGLPSAAGLGQSRPIQSTGANIGSGTSEQLTERGPVG